MARMLFVTWKDGSDPSQFSIPPDTTLADIIFTGQRHVTTLEDGSELYLDQPNIRCAYAIDVPDGTFITRVSHTAPE